MLQPPLSWFLFPVPVWISVLIAYFTLRVEIATLRVSKRTRPKLYWDPNAKCPWSEIKNAKHLHYVFDFSASDWLPWNTKKWDDDFFPPQCLLAFSPLCVFVQCNSIVQGARQVMQSNIRMHPSDHQVPFNYLVIQNPEHTSVEKSAAIPQRDGKEISHIRTLCWWIY